MRAKALTKMTKNNQENIDPNALTPMDALNLLCELRRRAEEGC
jgi:hypothetical protein